MKLCSLNEMTFQIIFFLHTSLLTSVKRILKKTDTKNAALKIYDFCN